MFDFLRRNIRKATILLIVSLFTFKFSGKIAEVVSGEKTCVCSYDGYGYYMYLTQLFQYRNLVLQQTEIQAVQDKYCDGIYAYQLKKMDNQNFVNIYHMGQAYIELPAYAVGHVFAKSLGYSKDGFSKPYHITFLLNALLFILLGVYFLNKILKLFFSDQVSALLLVIVYFGTNFWATAIHSYQLQHIYLFALIGCFFYCLLRLRENPKRTYLLVAALTLGLISAIRPTHVFLGVLPIIMLYKVYGGKLAYWKSILLFPLAGLLFNPPQLFYWKELGGSWFIFNLHVEEIVLTDPHISDFLFSYKKGWLLYTPVFLLLIPGFIQLYKQRKELFWAILSATVLLIWVFASWECWWYAASFGSRAMVDLYPILVLPLGFGIVYLGRRKLSSFILMGFVVGTFGLSVFQSEQFSRGYLNADRMTKSHYWYIFGKLEFPFYQENRLEIDRSNLEWPEKIEPEKLGFGKIEKTVFWDLNQKRVAGKSRKSLDEKPFFPTLKTDETLFELEVVYQANDSLNPATIHLESFSKYKIYNWKIYPLEAQKNNRETDTLLVRFNLPVIYHAKDRMRAYVVNPGNKELIIHSFKIKALSLIRN